MEKSEPTLVPEWLKINGSIGGGGGNRVHHSASSNSNSDNQAATLPTRSRLSQSTGDHDRSSSSFTERTSSSFHWKSNFNDSLIHEKGPSSHSRSYSSFTKSNRDRDRGKNLHDLRDKDTLIMRNNRDHEYHDSFGGSSDLFVNKIQKDRLLRRTQSMTSRKQDELGLTKVAADVNNKNSNHHFLNIGNSVVGSSHKVTFERDFPSLGAEEKQVSPDTGRVLPGLSTAVQNLPMSASAATGNGWTALADVPSLNGSHKTTFSSVQKPAASCLATAAPSTATGLNMAETLARAPPRARTPPQVDVESQRLEELAIKQSRQLIPKTSALNSEKSKPKLASRNEMIIANKNLQQLSSSHHVNHTARGAPAKPDIAKTSNGGKLIVLKASREMNGVSSVANGNVSPTNSSKQANNPLAPATSASLESPKNQKVELVDRKSSLSIIRSSSMEKRPTTSQTKSRSDFFNLMRKKTSQNLSVAVDPVPDVLESSSQLKPEVATPVSLQGSEAPLTDPLEDGVKTADDGDESGESRTFPDSDDYSVIDEKEAALLRSMGWNENAEEEIITEEEIIAFQKKYMELKPTLKLCNGVRQKKLDTLPKSCASDGSSDTYPEI